MGLRCGWCDKELGPERSGGRLSRALCGRCRESFVFQMGVPLQTLIDSLPAPIFVVDNDVRVKAANREGYALLKKGSEAVLEQLSGVVFDCAHAQLPEGCGRTVHCSGCAIRRSVYHTWETGELLVNVPATLKSARPGEAPEIALLVSTERMGDVILLEIERPGRGI